MWIDADGSVPSKYMQIHFVMCSRSHVHWLCHFLMCHTTALVQHFSVRKPLYSNNLPIAITSRHVHLNHLTILFIKHLLSCFVCMFINLACYEGYNMSDRDKPAVDVILENNWNVNNIQNSSSLKSKNLFLGNMKHSFLYKVNHFHQAFGLEIICYRHIGNIRPYNKCQSKRIYPMNFTAERKENFAVFLSNNDTAKCWKQ